jgi:hypothetical protein
MTTRFKKTLVLATAIISPLFISAPALANANANQNLVDPQAISLLTTSVKDSITAYDSLDRGDTVLAKRKLDQALRSMQSAVTKDPTLALSEKRATSLHQELKAVRTKLNTSDSVSAKSELRAVLSQAGVMLNS